MRVEGHAQMLTSRRKRKERHYQNPVSCALLLVKRMLYIIVTGKSVCVVTWQGKFKIAGEIKDINYPPKPNKSCKCNLTSIWLSSLR